MGKRLAIKGHPTRGKEVIKLLEMMGGENSLIISGCNFSGYEPFNLYYINDNGVINCKYHSLNKDMVILTLEEFLEKYPFKVGDKAINKYSGNALTIKSMKCSEDCETMMYTFKESSVILTAEDLKTVNMYKPLFKAGDVVKLKGCPDKNLFWIVMDVVKDGYIFNDGKKYPFDDQHHYEKSNREVLLTTPTTPSKMKNVLAELLEHIKTTPKEELEKEFKEIEDWSNVGPTVEEFMTFCESVNKKPTYPANYDECKAVLQLQDSKIQARCGYEWRLISYFQQLLMYRDAYWKIAGEQMGLDRPWEPDWSNDDETKFCIYTTQNIISLDIFGVDNRILAFPTEEMRDIFYKNFDYLIEACKELL